MKTTVIGIDLAKTSFSLCRVDESGKVLLRKELSRLKLIEFTANLEPTMIGFEACGGSHYWARVFKAQGHSVKMMSVARVKAFAPPQKKNDTSDAEAIALATLSSGVRAIQTKSVHQQDLEVIMNLREMLIKHRVALINQIHALALEYGVVLVKGKSADRVEGALSAVENAASLLSAAAREMIFEITDHAKRLDEKTKQLEKKLHAMMKGNENFKLLKTIPGVGDLSAIALLAHTGGDVSTFKNGRDFAAYLGLVPRQYSTGGKTKLGRITRSGPDHLRSLLVIGTTSVIVRAKNKTDRVSLWVNQKREAKGFRCASVALANKNARIIYGVLSSQRPYEIAA